MENKTNKKELSLWIECLTVIALATTLTFINCHKKEDDKTPQFAAAALASRGSGTVATATGTGTTYTVGGTITGLTASGLVLQNNAGDDLTVASGATSFTFVTKIATGAAYAVTVKTQPTAAFCSVSTGSGTTSANVTNVTVNCAPLMGGSIQSAISSLTGVVSVFAGPANGNTTAGTTDAIGTAASFSAPRGMTTDGVNLYVADQNNNRIRKIVISTGDVTTLAGNGSGNTDGTGTAALFNQPRAITMDGANLYVADSGNHRIRKIVISTGVVTTVAGNGSGNTDGTGTAALFNGAEGITTDGTNLYVSDTGNHRIRRIVISTGVVTTIAGNGAGNTDATGTAALFSNPSGITTDGTNLYVADAVNHRIRKIVISTGVVTTVAGNGNGNADGTGTAALFSFQNGITTDGTNLYIADSSNTRIRKIVIATAVVTTVAGNTSGDLDGTGTNALFSNSRGITTDGISLFVADSANNKIRRIR